MLPINMRSRLSQLYPIRINYRRFGNKLKDTPIKFTRFSFHKITSIGEIGKMRIVGLLERVYSLVLTSIARCSEQLLKKPINFYVDMRGDLIRPRIYFSPRRGIMRQLFFARGLSDVEREMTHILKIDFNKRAIFNLNEILSPFRLPIKHCHLHYEYSNDFKGLKNQKAFQAFLRTICALKNLKTLHLKCFVDDVGVFPLIISAITKTGHKLEALYITLLPTPDESIANAVSMQVLTIHTIVDAITSVPPSFFQKLVFFGDVARCVYALADHARLKTLFNIPCVDFIYSRKYDTSPSYAEARYLLSRFFKRVTNNDTIKLTLEKQGAMFHDSFFSTRWCKILNLKRCCIGNTQMKLLANLLNRCDIEVLNLAHTKIKKAGFQALASALPYNKKLRVLNVFKCSYNMYGVTYFIEQLCKNSCLKKVVMNAPYLTEQFANVEEYRTALSKLSKVNKTLSHLKIKFRCISFDNYIRIKSNDRFPCIFDMHVRSDKILWLYITRDAIRQIKEIAKKKLENASNIATIVAFMPFLSVEIPGFWYYFFNPDEDHIFKVNFRQLLPQYISKMVTKKFKSIRFQNVISEYILKCLVPSYSPEDKTLHVMTKEFCYERLNMIMDRVAFNGTTISKVYRNMCVEIMQDYFFRHCQQLLKCIGTEKDFQIARKDALQLLKHRRGGIHNE